MIALHRVINCIDLIVQTKEKPYKEVKEYDPNVGMKQRQLLLQQKKEKQRADMEKRQNALIQQEKLKEQMQMEKMKKM